MKATLGQESWQHIVHHSESLRVYEIQLSMNEHANHNVTFPYDSLVTVTDGQIFLESEGEETSLKANQAAWLSHEQALKCVAVSDIARLFIVVFVGQKKREKKKCERFASGTEHKHKLNSGITYWTVENKEFGKIELIMLPAQHKEADYYFKSSEQFILPLNYDSALSITFDQKNAQVIPKSGIVVTKGTSRSLFNRSSKPITYLSITTPYPSKSRVIKVHDHSKG